MPDSNLHTKPDNAKIYFSKLTHRFLLQSEHVMVKELVKLLVGVVDAQLLEGVGLEVLEAENVQNPDELGLIFAWKCKKKRN